MNEIKMIDKQGEWVLNTGESRIPDYVRHAENPGTELIIIEPGVPTKIVLSAFLKGQPTLRQIEDPTEGEIKFKVSKDDAPKAEAKAGK